MTRTSEQDLEIARLRALLAEAGVDPDASPQQSSPQQSSPQGPSRRDPSRDTLAEALGTIEALKQENERLEREAARTAGNYRLALSFGQARLAASEAELIRFEAILQSAIDFAIIVMDLDGLVRIWNEGATRILGWSAAEIEGQHVRTIFTPDDHAKGIPEREMTRSLVQDRANDERWHVRKDGERFFALGTMMPLRADDGTTLGYLKILRDETQRRLAEEQLRESEAFTRSILGASRDCIKVLDFDGRITAINENGLILLEADTIDQIRDFSWIDFWRDDRGIVETAIAAAKAGETGRFQARCPTLKGTMKWWDCIVTRIAGGETTGPRLLAVSRDITEVKQAALDIAESALRLRTILDTIPVGVLIADATGRIVEGNRRVAEILGHRGFGARDEGEERWIGLHADGQPVRHDDYPLRGVLRGTGAPASLEVDYQKGDGTRGWVRFEAAPIRDKAQGTTGAVVAITDIDEHKKAEAQQRFLMNELSHRVKNILAVVVSIARQTLRGANTIEDASEALLSRINALAGAHDVLMQQHWASADMKTLVAGAMKVQDGTGRQVSISGPDLRLGPQAALSLALVLHELGTNAVKYGALSTATGRVTIDWTREATSEPRLVFRWRESGGPSVVEPARTGFGSRLIKHSLSSFGTVTMAYEASGFVLDFAAPIKRIQQIDHP